METVFIIESNPVLNALYVREFELRGYKAESAFSGPGAVSKLQRSGSGIALLVVDLVIPGKEDVVRYLNGESSLGEVPVIGLADSAQTLLGAGGRPVFCSL